MPKIMLVNVTHPEESRVGVVDDGVLDSFEIESLSREHLKGNIYKGVVKRIHPALEAAFVDIGGDRDAFLPLDEVCFRNLPRRPEAGNGAASQDGRRRLRIRDVLRTGDEIVVQIAKEPFGNKPPTLTTYYSLPGRYLVLLPGTDEAGISRRIEGEERNRLRKLLSELHPPEGFGLIARTAAGFDDGTAEFDRDLGYLLRLWQNICRAATDKRAPALVYREHDIVLRTIRDFFTPDIDEIYIDNEEVFERARDFLQNLMPGKESVLNLYRGDQPIFSAFDVETQFESIFKRRVTLPSGGGIVIDATEALTAIDVNSGGSVRGSNPEETAFRTNKEAAAEVARQLRLRDLGGLIVVDFIDMREPSHIHEVERTMREAMRPDKARHELGHISRFGLMEISRQRLRPAAMATTYATCAMCEGHGAVRTTESAALVALRKIHDRIGLGDVAGLRVTLPVPVAMYLLNQKRDDLAQLEVRYRVRIHIQTNDKLMAHQAELETAARVEPPRAVSPGGVVEAELPAPSDAPVVGTPENGAEKKRRRRRGRRKGRGGGGLRSAMSIADTLTTLGSWVRRNAESMISSPATSAESPEAGPAKDSATTAAAAPGKGRRRRGRRGGGRAARAAAASVAAATPVPEDASVREVERGEAARVEPASPVAGAREAGSDATSSGAAKAEPKKVRRPSRRRPAAKKTTSAAEAKTSASQPPAEARKTGAKPARRASSRPAKRAKAPHAVSTAPAKPATRKPRPRRRVAAKSAPADDGGKS